MSTARSVLGPLLLCCAAIVAGCGEDVGPPETDGTTAPAAAYTVVTEPGDEGEIYVSVTGDENLRGTFLNVLEDFDEDVSRVLIQCAADDASVGLEAGHIAEGIRPRDDLDAARTGVDVGEMRFDQSDDCPPDAAVATAKQEALEDLQPDEPDRERLDRRLSLADAHDRVVASETEVLVTIVDSSSVGPSDTAVRSVIRDYVRSGFRRPLRIEWTIDGVVHELSADQVAAFAEADGDGVPDLPDVTQYRVP